MIDFDSEKKISLAKQHFVWLTCFFAVYKSFAGYLKPILDYMNIL